MFAESPIELALLRALDYRLQAGALLVPQVELPTQGGDFRADFLLVAGEQITLIECDGADFHTDLLDDHLRSAFILHAGWADQVLRFSGTMLHHAPDDAALWVNAVAPEALGERVALALRRLATSETAEEIDAQAKALRAGHVSARYYAHVQNLNVDPDLGKATRPPYGRRPIPPRSKERGILGLSVSRRPAALRARHARLPRPRTHRSQHR